MKRSRFVMGFSRVLLIPDIVSLLVWGGILVAWSISIYEAHGLDLWPYARIYSDRVTLLFVFACLGRPVLSFLFCLPINFVKFVVYGFLDLDDEGLPQSDWLLFELFGFLTLSAFPYVSRLLAWCAVLSLVYLFDNDSSTAAVVQFFHAQSGDIYAGSYPYFQIAAHIAIVLAAIIVRFGIWVIAGVRLEMWLGKYFQEKVFGERRLKALTEYADKIAERQGFLAAINRLFS